MYCQPLTPNQTGHSSDVCMQLSTSMPQLPVAVHAILMGNTLSGGHDCVRAVNTFALFLTPNQECERAIHELCMHPKSPLGNDIPCDPKSKKRQCGGLYMSRCMHLPSGVRALQHPHPGPHVLQLPCDVKRYATSSTHQDAGIVWTHLSPHHILPAPLLASAHAASTKYHDIPCEQQLYMG